MSLDKLTPVIRLTDMSEEMQKEVIEVARIAIDRSSTVNLYNLKILIGLINCNSH